MGRGFGRNDGPEFGPPEVDPDVYFDRSGSFNHPGGWQDRNHDGIPDSFQFGGFHGPPQGFGGFGGSGAPGPIPLDLDGDGRPDAWAWDQDRDGRAESWAWDHNQDGRPDQWAWDQDRDGRADMWAWDNDRNGRPDHWAWDQDRDGRADMWAWDNDRDGRADMWAWDHNGDGRPDHWVSAGRHSWDTRGCGRPDLWGVDRDGDGRIEYYERDTTGDGKPDMFGIAHPAGSNRTAWPVHWQPLGSGVHPENPLPPRSKLPFRWTRQLGKGRPGFIVSPPVSKVPGDRTQKGPAPHLEGTPLKPKPGVPYRFPVVGDWSFQDTWNSGRGGKRSHHGVDIFARTGTPVVAICDGVVTMLYNKGSAGLTVRLRGGDGQGYEYMHLDDISPKLKQTLEERFGSSRLADGDLKRVKATVSAGEELGTVGRSGFRPGSTTSPHLHFQAFPDHSFRLNRREGIDERLDPYDLLKSTLPAPSTGRPQVRHLDLTRP